MTVDRIRLASLRWVAIVLTLSAPAAAQTITVFDAPNATDTGPRGIDDSGQIVGSFVDATTGDARGLVRLPDGQITVLDLPPTWISMTVVGINASGVIIGSYVEPPANGVPGGGGFVFTPVDGLYTTFPGYPAAINDMGQILGFLSEIGVTLAGLHG